MESFVSLVEACGRPLRLENRPLAAIRIGMRAQDTPVVANRFVRISHVGPVCSRLRHDPVFAVDKPR
jgi:hypothetical protein